VSKKETPLEKTEKKIKCSYFRNFFYMKENKKVEFFFDDYQPFGELSAICGKTTNGLT
jgi:hypothetical protein